MYHIISKDEGGEETVESKFGPFSDPAEAWLKIDQLRARTWNKVNNIKFFVRGDDSSLPPHPGGLK